MRRVGNFGWFLMGFLLFALGERAFERRYSRQASRGECRMEWSYRLLHSLHLIIYVSTAAEYFLVKPRIEWFVTAPAILLFIVSVVIRLIAIHTLGKFWSLQLEIRQEHKLICDGIYRFVRHPAYLAIMIEVLAIPLVANAYFTCALALAVYVPVLLLRWRREEAEMIRQLGDVYVQYCCEVPAFVPLRPLLRRLCRK